MLHINEDIFLLFRKKAVYQFLHSFTSVFRLFVAKNNDANDIKTTLMDPNTRSLIKVNIGDIQNDMNVFQMLRGNTPQDLEGRRQLMKTLKIDRSLIDT